MYIHVYASEMIFDYGTISRKHLSLINNDIVSRCVVVV